MSLLELKNISKSYISKVGSFQVIDKLNLSVEHNQNIFLFGPSGCGKTTSLRIIAGLERASSGRILVENEDVTLLPATDRDVSMVFQSYALFPHMSVLENVSYGLKMINVPKEEFTENGTDNLGWLDFWNSPSRTTKTSDHKN